MRKKTFRIVLFCLLNAINLISCLTHACRNVVLSILNGQKERVCGGEILMANVCMQQELHVLRCCSTTLLCPLISTLAAFISTSLFSTPPLFFSSRSAPPLHNLASPSYLSRSSHPPLLLCCVFFFLPAHYPSPSLRCPPVSAVEYFPFPAFLLNLLSICFPSVTVVITFSLLSV